MTPLKHLSDDDFSQRVQQAVQALPDAPQAWQDAALALWALQPVQPPQPSQAGQALQALGRFVAAALRFDSWALPATAHGMRALRSPIRHLLFSAQGRDIDLRISPAGELFALAGQILGPDEAGRIELTPLAAHSAASHQATLDALGEFRIDAVAPGRYSLTLHMGDTPIVVQCVDVGEPSP